MRLHPADPEEQFSSHYDHGIDNQDVLQKIGEERAARNTKAWNELGECLRAIPVQPVNLSDSVMTKLTQEQIVTRTDVDRASSVSTTSRRVAMLATLAGLMLISVSISLISDKPNAFTAAIDAALIREVMSSPSKDWQIVVVSVSETQHDAVRDSIQNSLNDQGLKTQALKSPPAADSPADSNVWISSAEVSSQVLKALDRQEANDSETLLNSEMLEGLDRTELLARFEESMQSPTQSDRFFGEMLIVTPAKGTFTVSATSLPAELSEQSIALNNRPQRPASVLANEKGSDSATVTNAAPKSDGRRPVLLVLRKKKAPAEPTQGAIDDNSQGLPPARQQAA